MKRILSTTALVAVTITTLSLLGCAAPTAGGGGNAGPTASSESDQETWDPTAWDVTELCGDEPIKVGVHDGLATNTWRKAALAVLKNQISKCDNIDPEVVYTSSNSNPQQVSTDINSMVAAGVDVLISLDDFGDSELPAYRAAKAAGVTVVPYYGPIGGTPGEDYDANVYVNGYQVGVQMADWFGANVDSGNVIVVGDFATSTSSANLYRGVKEGLEKYPSLTLVGDSFLVGNYDPPTVSQVITGAIQNYGDISAVATQGFAPFLYMQPFIDSGEELPAMAGISGANTSYCQYEALPADERYPLATWESTTQVIAPALRRGLAERNDIEWGEPLAVAVPKFYDSEDNQAAVCDPALPMDFDLTTGLTTEQAIAALG